MRRPTALFVAAVASTTIFAGIASGADRHGSHHRDFIVGTPRADTLSGGDGGDWILGRGGDDTITGGAGNDLLRGGRGNDVLDGGAGRDFLVGGKGDDSIHGGAGNDVLRAGRGQDQLYGDDGNDRLWALARADVSGPDDKTGDTLHGGAGDDTFHTRDGEQDIVDCGDGNDRVLADFADVVDSSCETVVRKAPKSRDDAGENRTRAPRQDNMGR